MAEDIREVYAWSECRGDAFCKAIGVAVVDNTVVTDVYNLGKREHIIPKKPTIADLLVRMMDRHFEERGFAGYSNVRMGAAAVVRECILRHHDDGITMHDNEHSRQEVNSLVVVRNHGSDIGVDNFEDELLLPKVIFDGYIWRLYRPGDDILDFIKIDRGGITVPYLYGVQGGELFVHRDPEDLVVPDTLEP